ncbi:hypothetical protein [Oleisolibacter albus]|uniref:hypothetical protein n=1 Tax=Oleisolibacter albus TaxID=2171757 RepID=UPI0012D84200|nr:hypothetical protein [Oleisolibacter albus]
MRPVLNDNKTLSSAGEAESVAVRPAWARPELVEIDIWSVTGAKGSQVTEGGTTKNMS